MIDRLRNARLSTMSIGAALAGIVCIVVAPHFYDSFAVPSFGRGGVTAIGYHKGWDYFVVSLLTIGGAIGALLGALVLASSAPFEPAPPRPKGWAVAAIVVFVVMCFAHDHPYAFMDMYHDGEHLEPASVYLDGGRPYADTAVLHGLFADGALDQLVLGDPPNLLRRRRVETLLNAAALALLAPIAAEVTATAIGSIGALLVALGAVGAGMVVVFPYYRILPLLLAVWFLLRFVRLGKLWLIAAALAVSWFGLVWSLDAGIYSVAGSVAIVAIVCILRRDRRFALRAALIVVATALIPLAILLAWRADLHNFFVDSFITIPRATDAIGSLPARPLPDRSAFLHPLDFLSSETARYYLPPLFYGFLLVLALRAFARGERPLALRIAIVTLFSLAIFRTAAGRCSWSHTRYGVPLLGIALVAFVIEPSIRAARAEVWRIVALLIVAWPFVLYADLPLNAQYLGKYLAEWRQRQRHDQLVSYPLRRGRGLYTYRENAADLAALDALVEELAPPGTTIYDVSGERALYYFLDRRPATRCADTGLLAAPPLTAEALRDFEKRPPQLVILHGIKGLDTLDGVSNEVRIPEVMHWIDAHYRTRKEVGRYTVALP